MAAPSHRRGGGFPIGALEALLVNRLRMILCSLSLAVAVGCNGGKLRLDPSTTNGASSSAVDALAATSGDQQTAPAGTPLPAPLVVTATSAGSPVAGVTVTFIVSSGGGSLSVPSAVTDQLGQAQTTLILGQTPGTNTVVANIGTITTTFTETGS